MIIALAIFVPVLANAQKIEGSPPDMSVFENTQHYEKLLQKIIDEDDQWGKGELLISSSTIFAFIGFGSFLAIRFESGRKKFLLTLIKWILWCILAIGVSQIIIIISIVVNHFNDILYSGLMIMVITAFGFILLFIYQLIAEQTRDNELETNFKNVVNFFSSGLHSNDKEK